MRMKLTVRIFVTFSHVNPQNLMYLTLVLMRKLYAGRFF